jgi:hypothetical protein
MSTWIRVTTIPSPKSPLLLMAITCYSPGCRSFHQKNCYRRLVKG